MHFVSSGNHLVSCASLLRPFRWETRGEFIGAVSQVSPLCLFLCACNRACCKENDSQSSDLVLPVDKTKDHKTYLDEANVGALLTEALTADVEAVLADQTSRVGADAAVSTVLAMGPCA